MQGCIEPEALLGPLPDGWRVVCFGRVDAGMVFADDEKRAYTRDDSRLGALPIGWEQKSFEDDQLCWFNTLTTEFCWADPKLTAQALKERGVDVQDLFLI
jgi:hypothetical protein